MRQIILDEKAIQEFESKINSLPCFAKTVGENMAVSQAIQGLMQFMGSKIVETTTEEDPKPIGGGGGGAPKPKPNE